MPMSSEIASFPFPRGKSRFELCIRRTRYPGSESFYLPSFPTPVSGSVASSGRSSSLQSRGGGRFSLRFPEIRRNGRRCSLPRFPGKRRLTVQSSAFSDCAGDSNSAYFELFARYDSFLRRISLTIRGFWGRRFPLRPVNLWTYVRRSDRMKIWQGFSCASFPSAFPSSWLLALITERSECLRLVAASRWLNC